MRLSEVLDCEGAVLSPGNVHRADGWEEFIDLVVECYQKMAVRPLFRADAAFAKPDLYEYRVARHIGYAIRLPTNDVLQREIAHPLVRPTKNCLLKSPSSPIMTSLTWPRVGMFLGEW